MRPVTNSQMAMFSVPPSNYTSGAPGVLRLATEQVGEEKKEADMVATHWIGILNSRLLRTN